MTGDELLRDLKRRGVRLNLGPNQIHVEAAKGTLTDADREAIFKHAEELRQLLRLPMAGPTANQAARIRGYGVELGEGGPEWAERLLEPGTLTRDEAAEVLAWLDRRAAHDWRRETVR